MIKINHFSATDLEFKEIARVSNLVNHDSIDHPEDDKDDSKGYMFDVDELVKKKYSEYAKKDDLLSSLIRSMDIYDNQLLIEKVEIMIHNFTKLLFDVENPKIITQLPYWLIPIIEDNLKLYDNISDIISSSYKVQAINLGYRVAIVGLPNVG